MTISLSMAGAARRSSPDEIRENLGQGVFTPNFEGEAGLILG